MDHLRASTEVHFLPVHSCTIQKHQALDDRLPGLLLQTAFYRCCETTRVHFMVLRGINRTAWGTRLLLTPVLASFVDCVSLCHTLKAQHCSLGLNGFFNPPSAFHPPPHPPTPLPPTHPLKTQSVILQGLKKTV